MEGSSWRTLYRPRPDCLTEALIKLDNAGYKIAFHVHDEVVLDVPEGYGSIEEINALLSEDIPWAPGLPMGADGLSAGSTRKTRWR